MALRVQLERAAGSGVPVAGRVRRGLGADRPASGPGVPRRVAHASGARQRGRGDQRGSVDRRAEPDRAPGRERSADPDGRPVARRGARAVDGPIRPVRARRRALWLTDRCASELRPDRCSDHRSSDRDRRGRRPGRGGRRGRARTPIPACRASTAPGWSWPRASATSTPTSARPEARARRRSESGTRAAAHGGFTTVCAMPNTDPALDEPLPGRGPPRAGRRGQRPGPGHRCRDSGPRGDRPDRPPRPRRRGSRRGERRRSGDRVGGRARAGRSRTSLRWAWPWSSMPRTPAWRADRSCAAALPPPAWGSGRGRPARKRPSSSATWPSPRRPGAGSTSRTSPRPRRSTRFGGPGPPGRG